MNKAETIKQWFEISERKDWDAIARYVADEYMWVDHTLGTVARTPNEPLAATAEDEAWTDKSYTIDDAVEGVDGRMFVWVTVTQLSEIEVPLTRNPDGATVSFMTP
jgi:hypothetical protein